VDEAAAAYNALGGPAEQGDYARTLLARDEAGDREYA